MTMKQKLSKKLVVPKETVRNLSGIPKGVAGGTYETLAMGGCTDGHTEYGTLGWDMCNVDYGDGWTARRC
jgi:hypothetical protein